MTIATTTVATLQVFSIVFWELKKSKFLTWRLLKNYDVISTSFEVFIWFGEPQEKTTFRRSNTFQIAQEFRCILYSLDDLEVLEGMEGGRFSAAVSVLS